MLKSEIRILPDFFDRYINLVEDIDVVEGLKKFSPEVIFSDQLVLKALGDKVYALGKWTITEILQHCIDTERIMGYRALRFARNDKTQLPGFDEELFTANAEAADRTFDDLLAEYTRLRQSTIDLFTSFTDEMLQRRGATYVSEIDVLSLGFVIIGHAIHHNKIIIDRYYSLLD